MNTLTIILLLFLLLFSLIKKSGKESLLLIAAFLLRLAILILDYYHLVHIPFAGADTETFHYFALLKMAGYEVHFTHYTDFLVLIYSFTGTSRFFAQGINVAFSYCTLLVVNETTKIVGLSKKGQTVALFLTAFMPSLVAFSGILLREAWVQFFLTLSVYFFVRWYKRGGLTNVCLCFMSVLLSAYMHDGVLGAFIGYAIAFVLYRRQRNRESFTVGSFLALFIILAFALFVVNYLGSSIDSKFSAIMEEDLLETEISKNSGGSAYLQWMSGYSYGVSLLLSPIRMIYLLFSPIPFDWRGLLDIVVFCVDSSVYLFLFLTIFKKLKQASHLRKYLLISLLSITLLFAMGTSNSGTAIRHRAKFYPFLVLTYCVAIKERDDAKHGYRVEGRIR